MITRECLRRDVGRELPFQRVDLILDEEFAFFQSLYLLLIVRRGPNQAGDHFIEITMFEVQLFDPAF